jgi:hypothetical protein
MQNLMLHALHVCPHLLLFQQLPHNYAVGIVAAGINKASLFPSPSYL